VTNTIGIVWANPLEELALTFSPQNFPGVPESTVMRLLVQVFAYIPEQAQSQWQTSVRKGQAYKELQEKGQPGGVLSFYKKNQLIDDAENN